MLTNTGSPFEILNFLKGTDFDSSEEQDLISKTYFSIFTERGLVTNKDIILRLLNLLEQERNIVKQDIYRNALELVVGRTSDDI